MNSLYEYDLAHYPLNFEFLIWLVNCEMDRRRHGVVEKLRIRFTHAPSVEAELWCNHVFRPLLPMIGAVEDESENAEAPARMPFLSREHLLGEIVDAARWGEEVPRLQAPREADEWLDDQWLLGSDATPIVITLRECSYWPHRNSNLTAWLTFAADLTKQGEEVIFVRDTSKADERFGGFITCPEASRNLAVRMALYERARFCFFVANGPAGLAMFSRIPHVQLQTQYPGAQCPQWPWATKSQRLICATDSYENLSVEWERIKGTLTSTT